MASRIRTGTIQVEGLRELSRALKSMPKEVGKDLQKTNKAVAGFVAKDAKSAASALGGVAAKAAPSIRATASKTSAGVSFGGAAYPFAGGAEFGSIRYKQFQPWRGSSSDAGYFIYPTIRRDADRIATEYTQALDDFIGRAFPD